MKPVTLKEAFDRGHADYYAGKSRNAVPYSDAKKAQAWEKGYDRAVMAVRRLKNA